MVKSEGLAVSEVGRACWIIRYVCVSMSGRVELDTEGLAAGAGEERWGRTGA